MRYFTKEEDAFLLANYLIIPAKRMAAMLHRSEGTASQRMKLLRLIVPSEIIEKFKQESRFVTGHKSFNKGRKQSEYMTAAAIDRSKTTRFKKGQNPPNTKERDGVILIRTDYKKRKGQQYKWIRLSLGQWKQYHRYKWERKHGKIPEGLCLTFKDGNSLNTRLSNLELISRSENMKRNTIHRFPIELKSVIRLNNKLKRTINEKQN